MTGDDRARGKGQGAGGRRESDGGYHSEIKVRNENNGTEQSGMLTPTSPKRGVRRIISGKCGAAGGSSSSSSAGQFYAVVIRLRLLEKDWHSISFLRQTRHTEICPSSLSFIYLRHFPEWLWACPHRFNGA